MCDESQKRLGFDKKPLFKHKVPKILFQLKHQKTS